jgi:C-terminal processing protease CtpA/Prc
MKRYKIILALAVISFSSCEKLIFKKDKETLNPKENFEYLWNECDKKYSYFELKKIDWNQIHDKYEKKIYDGMSQDSLFKVLGAMLRELKDDHTNLFSDLNNSFYGTEQLGQDNYDSRILRDNYLPKEYYISGPFVHDFILNTNKEIGYVRFSGFTGEVDDKNLNFILERYKNTKGLILDLRENGGGLVNEVFKILSRFVEESTLLYYSKIKNGEGHNDFSEPQPAYIEPSKEIRYTNKVMVLVDRGTYSAGSMFALATKALPNMVLVGDLTGGGLGLPNGGQLPNGWTYRFSVTQALDLQLNNSYEQGVPPDIYQLFDWNNLMKDEILERAIWELN